MRKKHKYVGELLKGLLIPISILVIGIAFTITSFCVYYLITPFNTAALVCVCTVDFIYTVISSCLMLKYFDVKKFILKGVLLAVGYIPLFIVVPILFILANGEFAVLQSSINAIVIYAFFTGPCIFIVLTLAALVLCLIGQGG